MSPTNGCPNQAFFLYAKAKTQITENPRNSDNFSKLRSKVGKTQILRHIQVARKDSHSPDICDSPDKRQKFKHFSTQIIIFSKLRSQFIQNSDQNLQNSDQNCKTSMKIPKLRSILTQNSDQFAQNSDITTLSGRAVS